MHLRSLGPQAAHFTVTPQHLQLSYRAGGGLQKGLKPRGRERAETQPTFPLPDRVAKLRKGAVWAGFYPG